MKYLFIVIALFLSINQAFAQPILTGFDVSQGQTQRSFLRYVELQFDTNLGLGGLALELTKFDLQGNNGTVITLPSTSVSGQSVWLDFGASGIGGNAGTTAGNGYYSIAVDTDGNGSFESVKYFYRILGDVNAGGGVTGSDKTQVLAAQGGPYDIESDVNGNGVVNIVDTSLCSRQMNVSLNNTLQLDD